MLHSCSIFKLIGAVAAWISAGRVAQQHSEPSGWWRRSFRVRGSAFTGAEITHSFPDSCLKNCPFAGNCHLSRFERAALLRNAEIFTRQAVQGYKRLSLSSWSCLIITCSFFLPLNSVSPHFIPASCNWEYPTGRPETRCVYVRTFIKGFRMKFRIKTWIRQHKGHPHIRFLTISLERLGFYRQKSSK